MKKAIIGLVILGTLILYSLGIRHEQSETTPPTSLTTKKSRADTSGGSGTPTANNPARSSSPAAYKDGTYTGSTEDAFYGNVQVRTVVRNGKIASVTFLQYPHTHSTSVEINQQAVPDLQQEAIQAQSAHVDTISGATYTSQAFVQSLTNALSQAS